MSTQSGALDEEPELAPGTDVGSYRILRRIGRGSMGTVYEAEHRYLERRAAIKVLAAELSESPRLSRRFRAEANALDRVEHPGFVEVYEFGFMGDGLAFFVMELLVGETLAARLLRRGPCSALAAVRVAREIASAMAAAHAAGIVHRDLKPDNLMLVEVRGEERVKILDFGVAKVRRERAGTFPTQTGTALGTPAYMAPEQCIDSGRAGPPADVYALGIVLYELLVGAAPFRAETSFDVMAMHVRQPPPPLAAKVPGLPARLVDLVGAMLAEDPAARPTMTETAEALEGLAKEEEKTTGPATPEPAPRRWTGSRRVAAGLLALGLASAGAWTAWRLQAGRPAPPTTTAIAPPPPPAHAAPESAVATPVPNSTAPAPTIARTEGGAAREGVPQTSQDARPKRTTRAPRRREHPAAPYEPVELDP